MDESPHSHGLEQDTLPSHPRVYRRHWGWNLLASASIFAMVCVVISLIGLWVLTRDLPLLRSLDDYHPPQTSIVYGYQGQVVGRFSSERRTVVPFEKIPQIMIDAVISSEDADFFEHQGVDLLGIGRCIVKNFLAGRKRCGGSTITQQTVKTFFLTPKKTYLRKLRELILAKRVEEALTKEQILFLYLNQIYFGHGAYGVQEASQTYFGKDVEEISVPEAALLAGLPQSPSRLDPYRHLERATKRRSYVLKRLHEQGKISTEVLEQSLEQPITLGKGDIYKHLDNSNHYISHLKQLLINDPAIGEENLLTGGLSIYTGLDPNLQANAQTALENGVAAVDKRQGWRGPMYHLEVSKMRTVLGLLDAELAQKRTPPSEPLVWDLNKFASAPVNLPPRDLITRAKFKTFSPNEIYGGIVTAVEDATRRAIVSLGSHYTVALPISNGLSWARPFSIEGSTRRPNRPSDVLSVGDIVLVKPIKPASDSKRASSPEANLTHKQWIGQLEQEPLSQAAVVVIDSSTREVRAMSGGYGSGAGAFNRAIQAKRQAGSAFKPFVYAAAFNTRKFTPVSECLDAPRVFYEPSAQRSWKPRNYTRTFDGAITLRTALTLSKNVCSVRLIDKIGVDAVISAASKMGIKSQLPRNFSLALGSGDVTPIEIVNAYATLADEGRFTDPIFIRRVVTPSGEQLINREPQHQQAIAPGVAYLVTSLMQSVVEEGTAQRVKVLNRPIAGKTGTTNEARNAWFVGFTPDLVAGVWVGFDDNRPLGPTESGGRAAIPIWLETMQSALESRPHLDFVAPSDIVFTLVDPESGKLAPLNHPGARTEPFISGTEPSEFIDNEISDKALWVDYE